MKTIIAIFIAFVITISGYSQDLEIEKIRIYYNKIISQIQNEELTPIDLNLSITRPAIGPQQTNIKFYWNNNSSISYDEDEHGKALTNVNRQLFMITVKYNIAASSEIYIEYVFDENKQLVFYFSRTTGAQVHEVRMYFNNNSLIKLYSKTFDSNPDFNSSKVTNEKTETSAFSATTKTLSAEVLKKSSNYKLYFDNLFKIENEH